MDFVRYVEFTDTVALYPKTAESTYLAMGIGDELAELVEAVEAAQNDNDVLSEAGDVFWYLLRYASKVLEINLTDLEESVLAQISPCEDGFSSEAILNLGSILGYEKKKIRDYDTWSDEKKADKRSKAVGDVHQLCFEVANILFSHGFEVEACLKKNVDKLSGRKKEGKLQGDGSNR